MSCELPVPTPASMPGPSERKVLVTGYRRHRRTEEPQLPPPEENWEPDIVPGQPGYVPLASTQQPVFREVNSMSHSEKKQYYIELLKQYKGAHEETSQEEGKEPKQAVEVVSTSKETADCASSSKPAIVPASESDGPPSATTVMDAMCIDKAGELDRSNIALRQLQQPFFQPTPVALVHPQPSMRGSELELFAASPDIIAINHLRTLLQAMQVSAYYDPYADEASYQAAGRGSTVPRTSVYGWIVSSDDEGGICYQTPRGRGRPLY